MNYHRITYDDMLNGEGLRVVLWVAGCDNHCLECQNPETWAPEGGQIFDASAYVELISLFSKDYVKGLTLSGGDPLFKDNIATVETLCRLCKEQMPDKDIWCYTGRLWEDVKDLPAIRYIDVLVDGPYQKDLRDVQAHWVGSRNQRIIDVRQSLASNSIVLYESI